MSFGGEPGAGNGPLRWRGQGFLENGQVVGGAGEGAFEALGNHKWRTRLVITTTDGQIFASDGELDLATRSLKGKNLEWSRGRLSRQRIRGLEGREAAEVAVGRPELPDSVGRAERCDARVVDAWAGDAPCVEQSTKLCPVLGALGEELETRRLEPGVDLTASRVGRRGWIPDARVSGDGQEFVDAGPGDRPGGAALCELPHAGSGALVPLGLCAVRVQENVGVDGDHPPRSS